MKSRALFHHRSPALFATALVAAIALHAAPGSFAQIVNAPPAPDWIQAAAIGSDTNAPAFFRKTFSSDTKLLKAILLAASDTTLEVFLNGTAAGQLTGRNQAGSLDVTALVRPGQNLLAIRAKSSAPLIVLLELNGDLARKNFVLSDSTWLASTTTTPDWTTPAFAATGWQPAHSLGRVDATPATNPFDPKRAIDAYNSWKLALASSQSAATDPATFTLLPGFRAELIRSATTNEGSWVALAFDPRGRLTLAREKRGLLRLTFAAPALSQRREPPAATITPTSSPAPEVTRVEVINDTLLECRGLLYAHGALFANANNTKALFRLRDTQGNDQFDEITELLRTEGGVGHGRNHLKLGPDGWLWIAHGNNVLLPKNLSTNSPLRNYAHDRLIPNPWDAGMFDGNVQLPAGHILRVKPDGSEVQLYAGGFRNPLDLAFNHHGDLFTFDADMEWDVGTPWYMPNRVLHVLPGADFGWRRGTSRFPAWYPDTQPSVLDIGLASPTGVIFGYGAKFPWKYQNALYVCDWAYGRILAVQLKSDKFGTSYTGTSELFIGGRPMNVTDACIGPDGAMWFTTGGRGTQSGLYRVDYDAQRIKGFRFVWLDDSQYGLGPFSPIPPQTIKQFWAGLPRNLNSREFWDAIRYGILPTGRVQLERSATPTAIMEERPDEILRQWRELKVALSPEWVAATARLVARFGDPSDKPEVLRRLFALPLANPQINHPLLVQLSLSDDQRITALRALALTFIRLGPPDEAQRQAGLHWLEPLYPATDSRVNQMLVELLVYLRSPQVIPKTLALLRDATTSEDLLHYPFFLRYVTNGWTLDARRTVFESLARAELLPGARQYFKALQDIRKEMLATLTPAEREALAPVLAPAPPKPVAPATPAVFVKNWKLEDLVPRLAEASRGRSWEGARTAFVQAQCVLCHRVSADAALPASVLGPDLSSVASRFNRRDLLEQILAPSKIIDEKFRTTTLFLADGSDLSGTIESEDATKLLLRPNPLSPDTIEITKSTIRRREHSKVSPMPAELLNTLTAEQILDLLAWFEASGKPDHAVFKK